MEKRDGDGMMCVECDKRIDDGDGFAYASEPYHETCATNRLLVTILDVLSDIVAKIGCYGS